MHRFAIPSPQAFPYREGRLYSFTTRRIRSALPMFGLGSRDTGVPEERLEDGLEGEGVVSVRNSISHTVAVSIWELSQLTAPRAQA